MDRPPCPLCGGALQLVARCPVEVEHAPCYLVRRNGTEIVLPRWVHLAPAALCDACDFAIEITKEHK